MAKYKILIAEDDTDINHLLCRILGKSDYQTIQAFSGTEAKLLLQLEVPDLMLLDLMLPGMSGEELIRKVRMDMGLDLPILVLSAKAGLDSKVQALKSGADEYLTKPFEPEEVLARVFAALRRYKAEGRKENVRDEGYRFYTSDSSRSEGSTGLGLPIARHLAEEMGGGLTAGIKVRGQCWLSFLLQLPGNQHIMDIP